MKKLYIKNLLTILFIVLSVCSAFAQQVPNPSFEDWGGEKFDGEIQPAIFRFSFSQTFCKELRYASAGIYISM